MRRDTQSEYEEDSLARLPLLAEPYDSSSSSSGRWWQNERGANAALHASCQSVNGPPVVLPRTSTPTRTVQLAPTTVTKGNAITGSEHKQPEPPVPFILSPLSATDGRTVILSGERDARLVCVGQAECMRAGMQAGDRQSECSRAAGVEHCTGRRWSLLVPRIVCGWALHVASTSLNGQATDAFRLAADYHRMEGGKWEME